MIQGLLGRHPDMMGSCGPCWLLNFRYLGVGMMPGTSAGRGYGVEGTKGRFWALGLGSPVVTPSHSRLKADRGLHPGPAQGLSAELHLGHGTFEVGLGLGSASPPSSTGTHRTYLPLVEIRVLGLEGARKATVKKAGPCWGLTSHPGLEENGPGLYPTPQSPLL